MGFSPDSARTYKFVPILDQSLPQDQQRAFYFRYVSARDFGRIEELFNESMNTQGTAKQIDKIKEMMRVGLVGWEGIETPFDVDRLDEVASVADLFELRDNAYFDAALSEIEKKRAAYGSKRSTQPTAKSETASA